MVELADIDLEYIEFLSQRRGVAPDAVRERYAGVKKRFLFKEVDVRTLAAERARNA